jgi:SAM-dependent methyltransferase
MELSLRKRLFAWILKRGDELNHRLYGGMKLPLFRSISGTVVEVGPGSGINFRYLPESISWIGIEPNRAFHDHLFAQAQRFGISAQCLDGSAERIPLPNDHADAVICTLVLCSVNDPDAVAAELKRILKPNGRLYFIEHVAAHSGSMLRSAQNFLNPLNRLIADGCSCNRETWLALERAGFSTLNIDHSSVLGSFSIHSPHISGFAVK